MKHTFILALFLFTLIGCSSQQIKNETPLINTINRGEKFRITLPENHTTGYMWLMNPKINNQVLDYYGSVFHGNEKGVDFNFKTLNKGQDTINFTLIKYRDTAEVKQFIINVE